MGRPRKGSRKKKGMNHEEAEHHMTPAQPSAQEEVNVADQTLEEEINVADQTLEKEINVLDQTLEEEINDVDQTLEEEMNDADRTIKVERNEADKGEEKNGEDQDKIVVENEADEEEIRNDEDQVKDAVQPQRKKLRGPTKMKDIAKDPNYRESVDLTYMGEPYGPGSVKLSSYLGPLVREHVSIVIDDWRKVGKDIRTILWKSVQVTNN